MKDKWKKQKKLDQVFIERGYDRVLKKIKHMRQIFANAFTTSRRSGSGKILLEFYDELQKKLSPPLANENEEQHDSSCGYVPTNPDAEHDKGLADNLPDLSNPLLTSTEKEKSAKPSRTSTKQVQY